MHPKSKYIGLIIGFASLLFPSLSFGYYETAESGEIIKPGTYDAGVMPQIRLSEGSGANLSAFFDTAFNESSSFRVLLGGGETDFYTGASFKYIPIPDAEKQPAVGAKLEVIYARKNTDSAVSLRVHPMVSKKYEIEQGTLIPYLALPIGTITYQNSTNVPLNIVAGSEFHSNQIPDWHFGGEIGLEVNKSFSYISAFAVYHFDDSAFPANKKKK